MGQAGDDFEKGEADGTRDALNVLKNLVSGFQFGKPLLSR
jgi:hypothetical protein